MKPQPKAPIKENSGLWSLLSYFKVDHCTMFIKKNFFWAPIIQSHEIAKILNEETYLIQICQSFSLWFSINTIV